MKPIYTLFIITFSLMALSCSSPGHHYITINAPSFAAVMVPEQLNTFLNKNGFHRAEFSARVNDPNSGPLGVLNKKRGVVLTEENHLLMRYQHETYSQFFIDTKIVRNTGKIYLDFYEQGRKDLSDDALSIYNQLKENLSSRLYDKNDFKES